MLINNAETYYNKIYGWITNLLDKNPKVEDWVNENLETYYQNLLDLLTNKVLPGAQQMLTTITGGVISGIWGLVSFAMDFLVGIIVSVYMLAMKEQSLARCCKLLYGVCKEAHARWIARAVRRADGIFSGFVRGKLLDSLIIGILCLIGCTILGMPYAPLVSLIVGVTNVIPFFGPFIGAIPATLLILIQSPIKALWFVLFVLVLQQLDGNIIGPKILGNTTGLSSFWVLFAILLFGGLWGFVGMIVGVPLFAVIYDVIKKLVIHGLQRNQELTLLNSYHDQFGDPTDDAAAQPAAPQPAENQ